MPLGRDGKMPAGRLTFLIKCSQKHLGQSKNRFNDEGDSLMGFIIYKDNSLYLNIS